MNEHFIYLFIKLNVKRSRKAYLSAYPGVLEQTASVVLSYCSLQPNP